MKKKTSVLFSAAGGSPFPYIFNLLKRKYNVYALDSNTVIKKIYPQEKILIVPLVSSAKYQRTIKKIIEKYKINFYIPLIDEEISKAHAIAKDIKQLKIIAPRANFVKLCLNKFSLMKELEKKKISKVLTILTKDIEPNFLKFPIFIKPIVGRGSRGSRKINNKDQLAAYFHFEDYSPEQTMIQEYLAGVEYTVSVVVNNKNKLMAIVPKRIIVKKGITQQAVTERNKIITKLCQKIVEILKPQGPFNVQLTMVGNQPKVFEINPRFSTTSILTSEAGVNGFALCIENFGKNKIEQVNFKEGIHIYRRWESCFHE